MEMIYMTYIVIELQTNANDTVGILTDSYTNRDTAEQKYHMVLSAAAVSALPSHAAVMITGDGQLVKREVYHHDVA